MNRSKRTLATLGLAVLGIALAGCPPSQEVQIGVVLPLTGPSAVYGLSVQRGVELANEHLAEADIPYTIEVEILDSGSNPAEAARLAEQLFGPSIAVLGGVTSSEALAMVDPTGTAGKVMVSPTASSDKLSRATRHSFRLFTTTLQESSAMATFVDDTLKSERVTIIREPGEPGDGFTEGFTNAFETAGGEISGVIDVDPEGDIAAVAAQARETNPGAIYIAAEGYTISMLIKALRESGFGTNPERQSTAGQQQWLLSTSSFSSPELIAAAGAGAQDVYITQSVFDLASEDGAMPAFVAAYREKYGEEPDIYAGHGYDSLMLLGEATRNIVNTLPSEYLKGIRSVEGMPGVSAIELRFNEAGDAQKFPRIHWIDNGKPRDFQKAMDERLDEMREKMREIERATQRLKRQGAS